MSAFEFIVLALASGAVVDAWRNGSLFDSIRPKDDDERYPHWLRELLSCDFCLGHHVPWVLALATWAVAPAVPGPWDRLVSLPVYALAAGRAAWLLNGLLPGRLQYLPIDGVRAGQTIVHAESLDAPVD